MGMDGQKMTPESEVGLFDDQEEYVGDSDDCEDVNHINDNPGYYTCDCVELDDPCLTDEVCVPEENCPDMDGQKMTTEFDVGYREMEVGLFMDNENEEEYVGDSDDCEDVNHINDNPG